MWVGGVLGVCNHCMFDRKCCDLGPNLRPTLRRESPVIIPEEEKKKKKKHVAAFGSSKAFVSQTGDIKFLTLGLDIVSGCNVCRHAPLGGWAEPPWSALGLVIERRGGQQRKLLYFRL